MGCWGLLGWLLLVMTGIIPSNSLCLAPVRGSFCFWHPSFNLVQLIAAKVWVLWGFDGCSQCAGCPEWGHAPLAETLGALVPWWTPRKVVDRIVDFCPSPDRAGSIAYWSWPWYCVYSLLMNRFKVPAEGEQSEHDMCRWLSGADKIVQSFDIPKSGVWGLL